MDSSWEFCYPCVTINFREAVIGVDKVAKINGIVKNKQGDLLENAEVLFVDRSFEVLTSGYSNDEGEYYLQINEKANGMVMATYAYGEKYLGFTFANLNSGTAHRVDVILGNVEFINFTRVINKNRDDLTYQFQLASLDAMTKKKKNISPESKPKMFEIFIGEQKIEGYELVKVEKQIGGKNQFIDEYTVVLKKEKSQRGNVLKIEYQDENSFGMVKAIL